MRWLRKCTSLGWYFASVTSYKRCNFLWPSSSRFLGSLDLPQNRYIGPPRCADYENVPLWGGILPRSQVTSVVTFQQQIFGVSRFAPNSVYTASLMRWLRKCTSLGWYFASVTSYKRCNFLWPSSSRFLGSLDLPQNRYIGPPWCADYEKPLWGGILPRSQVTSVVTFQQQIFGVSRFAPKSVYRASWCADYENVPLWGGILPLSQVTSVITFCDLPAADFWGLSICPKIGI